MELNEKELNLLIDVVSQAWAQQAAYAMMGTAPDNGETRKLKALEIKLIRQKGAISKP